MPARSFMRLRAALSLLAHAFNFIHPSIWVQSLDRWIPIGRDAATVPSGLLQEAVSTGESPMEGSRGRCRWGGRRRSMLMVALALCFVVGVSLCCCARSGACSASGCSGRSTVVALRSDFWRRRTASFGNQERLGASGSGGGRRLLVVAGPGSYPPRCTSKCGSCNPCYPVHVAVPPGVPVTTEYYPEAWRCRCGNRLYMP
ncbi:uncharacterized protein LOC119277433 isoform X1 [Triticum dicoccoides]|uniref:uncharacterized protein LOC119277433 isoform X1 n=1 Tax=Triticum dicoccoides TaxID=85692 RepID=UPI00188FDB5B|nr:uncharacterized protein LOC119277433 isoform X1 [Triticum dicoccoides]XP_044350690.1 uncharacterized protein LOC123071240 isoform X1 [Triticum aestivum]